MVNFELLRAISSYLIEIIDNSHVNKMTVRNVGIVFAPTLNIPAPLISMFLTDFPDIFGTPLDEANSPIHEIHVSAPPLGDEAIRSPRRQMFSDLPTPAYNETSFQRFESPSSFPMGQGGYQQPSQQQQQNQQQQNQQQQNQQQPEYANYDTGFTPLQPSYNTAPSYETQYKAEGYGSLNGAVSSGSAREIKQRRRESGMLLMNMGQGQRKSSNPRMRETNNYDPRMDPRLDPRMDPNPRPDPRVDPRLVRDGTAFD
jgi:RalA-binding protein 1